jgi:hypothetical protein
MSTSQAAAIVAGALGAGYVVIGLFFLRFWTRTRDNLFLGFAVAFALIAVGQVLPVLVGFSGDRRASVYLVRLAGFVLIIAAIVRKNLHARRRP